MADHNTLCLLILKVTIHNVDCGDSEMFPQNTFVDPIGHKQLAARTS